MRKVYSVKLIANKEAIHVKSCNSMQEAMLWQSANNVVGCSYISTETIKDYINYADVNDRLFKLFCNVAFYLIPVLIGLGLLNF